MNTLKLSLYCVAAVLTTTLLMTETNTETFDFGFAIDSTGSMHDEIVAVRKGVGQILKTRPPGIANFSLVVFNDPSVGPTMTSANPESINSFMDKIVPNAGGDCPEMAMAALLKIISMIQPNSVVFFFSDASAKDYSRATEVTTSAKAKNVTILFVLTGCCGDCNSAYFNAYKTVERETNGKIYIVKKSEVTKFMDYVIVTVVKNISSLRKPPQNFSDVADTAKGLPDVLKSLNSTTTTKVPTTMTTTTKEPSTTANATEEPTPATTEMPPVDVSYLLTKENSNSMCRTMDTVVRDLPYNGDPKRWPQQLQSLFKTFLDSVAVPWAALPGLLKEYEARGFRSRDHTMVAPSTSSLRWNTTARGFVFVNDGPQASGAAFVVRLDGRIPCRTAVSSVRLLSENISSFESTWPVVQWSNLNGICANPISSDPRNALPDFILTFILVILAASCGTISL